MSNIGPKLSTQRAMTHRTLDRSNQALETANETETSSTDVVILDSNSVLSTVLATHLSAKLSIKCVGLQIGDENVVRTIERYKPKIVLVDPFDLPLTPVNDLRDFGRKVLITSPQTRLLGYTQRMDENILKGILSANFAGCVDKQSDINQLEIALLAVRSGGVYFDPEFSVLLKDAINGGTDSSTNTLSRREQSVIIMTAKGQPAKQIANNLKISPKTVETYKSRALSKLGLANREELIEHAASNGWLS